MTIAFIEIYQQDKTKRFKEQQQWETGSIANLKIIIAVDHQLNDHLFLDQVDIKG